MRKMMFCFVCLLLVGYACYAGLPKDHNQPKDSTRSIIGISVTQRDPMRIKRKSKKVVFLKMENSDNGEDVKIIVSNYSKGGRIYLINADPGKYTVMAAHCAFLGYIGFTLFSEEAVNASEIEVKPGEFAYIGKFVINNSSKLSKCDNVQEENLSRLKEIKDRKDIRKLFSSILRGSKNIYRGTLKKYDKSEKEEFLKKAKEDFKKTGWLDILNKK
jgi:hypothetical protein